MRRITKVILKDTEITDPELVEFIADCMVETGGIQHVQRNLTELGYPDFATRAYAQLDEATTTETLTFHELTSNQFLVICLTVFATVKEVEQDVLIARSFEDGVRLLRTI